MSENGVFHWNELMINNPESAKNYYGVTIGWTFDAMEMDQGGTFWICMSGGRPCGGIMSMQGVAPEGSPPHWFSYLAADDLATRLEKAKSIGGIVLRKPFTVPGIGTIAMAQDPQGAAVGWIEPAS